MNEVSEISEGLKLNHQFKYNESCDKTNRSIKPQLNDRTQKFDKLNLILDFKLPA